MHEIYSIAPTRPFLPALAGKLLDEASSAPESLANKLILTPNRRASRALADCLFSLHQTKQTDTQAQSLIMPMMRALGDQDDEIALFQAPDMANDELQIPPAMNDSERLMLLCRLIASWQKDIHKERVFMLASALAHVMDQIETEDLKLETLKELAPEDLAEQWQITLEFLNILGENWPDIEKETGKISPAKRRRLLIDQQIKRWQAKPPSYEVIIAGSTGSVIDVTKMIDCVSQLHHHGGQGRVILPGFDANMGKDMKAILKEESHPQHNLARLLAYLKISVNDVRPWPKTAFESPEENAKLAHFISDAFVPAENQSLAIHRHKGDAIRIDDLSSLTVMDFNTMQEEAEFIALKLRETINDKHKTAALITPARELARRVIAQMQRWNILLDDSAGQSAAMKPVGVFFLLISQMMEQGLSLSKALSLWQHPLFCMAVNGERLNRAQIISISRDIEDIFIQNQDMGFTINAFLDHDKDIKGFDDTKKPLIKPFIRSFLETIADLQKLYDDYPIKPINFKQWLVAHITVAEKLAGHDETDRPDKAWLWQQEDGQAISQLLSDYLDHADKMGHLQGTDYHGLMTTILRRKVVRPRHGLHPRLHILSPLEARLMDFDVTILGGLNQGSWPEDSINDPFMSRPMRKSFGLPGLERKIGLQAHDFYYHIHQKNVILTYAKRIGNAPVIPSRWIERLGVVAQKQGFTLEDLATNKHLYLSWLDQLKRPRQADNIPAPQPKPAPPLQARLTKLSVTNIKLLRDNPYHIYAKYILNLRERGVLDAEPDHAQKGTLIHKILEDYFKNLKNPQDFNIRALLALGEAYFGPLNHDYPEFHFHWWLRFVEACNFVKNLHDRDEFGMVMRYFTEIRGEAKITLTNGKDFTLEGRVDRLDLLDDDGVIINDYKSGTPPTANSLVQGHDPQMGLLGLIMEKGGFDLMNDKANIHPKALQIINVSGKADAKPIIIDLTNEKNQDFFINIEDNLIALLSYYFTRDDSCFIANRPETTSYESPYDHLSRALEWMKFSDEED